MLTQNCSKWIRIKLLGYTSVRMQDTRAHQLILTAWVQWIEDPQGTQDVRCAEACDGCGSVKSGGREEECSGISENVHTSAQVCPLITDHHSQTHILGWRKKTSTNYMYVYIICVAEHLVENCSETQLPKDKIKEAVNGGQIAINNYYPLFWKTGKSFGMFY